MTGYCSSCGRTFGDRNRPPCAVCVDQGVGHITQRDRGIRDAHASVTSAIRQLDQASIHAREIDDGVHVDHLSQIIRQLSAAREPLAEHLDWLEANAS